MSFHISEKTREKIINAIIAALSAALTALTTTSCMGYGPLWSA